MVYLRFSSIQRKTYKLMKKFPPAFLRKFRHYGIYSVLLAGFLIFSNISATSQGFFKKRKDRDKVFKSKVEFKKNIIWLEGLGSNQVVGIKYERIFMFGSFFSMRFDAGITPFVVDEKYNFIVGRSITPITG